MERKNGVISYWYRTGGKYNTAYLQIEKDTLTYIKERVGGWVNLQHNGEKGERVSFYTICKQEKGLRHYFGLSDERSSRESFWIFMDILCYTFHSYIFLYLIGWVGIFGFNTIMLKRCLIKNISWAISFLTIFLITISSFS